MPKKLWLWIRRTLTIYDRPVIWETHPLKEEWDGVGTLIIQAMVNVKVSAVRLINRSGVKIPFPGFICDPTGNADGTGHGNGCRHGTKEHPACSMRWRFHVPRIGKFKGQVLLAVYLYVRNRWFRFIRCGRSYKSNRPITNGRHDLEVHVTWNDPGKANGSVVVYLDRAVVDHQEPVIVARKLKWDTPNDAVETVGSMLVLMNYWPATPCGVDYVTLENVRYSVKR